MLTAFLKHRSCDILYFSYCQLITWKEYDTECTVLTGTVYVTKAKAYSSLPQTIIFVNKY